MFLSWAVGVRRRDVFTMRRQSLWIALGACALAFASCGTGSSPESADQTGVSAAEAPAPTQPADVATTLETEPGRSIVTANPTVDGASTSSSATTAPDDTTTTTVATNEDVLRLAPAAASASPHLRWDRNSISDLGHAGSLPGVSIASLDEVSAVPLGLPVFQAGGNERVIWELTEAGPIELLMVPESEALTLEGAGLDPDGEPVIFYQHHVYGDPETTRSMLRRFRPSDGELTDIATTGGWESGVTFSHLNPLGEGRGDVTVALWGAEGWVWFETIDIVSGQILFNSESAFTGECFAGATDCPDYLHAVVLESDVIGLRAVPAEGNDPVTEFGLWRFDTATGSEELLVSWPWDNGRWYAEDMFVGQGSTLVLSLEDGDGNPLPALHHDIATGQSWTEPEAAFLRPAFLS